MTIRLERTIAATPQRVERAWSDPRQLERWAWGSVGADCEAHVDFRVGGSLCVTTRTPDGETWSFEGTFEEIEPSHGLTHSLSWNAPMGYEPIPERVRVRLAREGDVTRVSFEHEAELSEEAAAEHERGWNDVLDALKRTVEADAES